MAAFTRFDFLSHFFEPRTNFYGEGNGLCVHLVCFFVGTCSCLVFKEQPVVIFARRQAARNLVQTSNEQFVGPLLQHRIRVALDFVDNYWISYCHGNLWLAQTMRALVVFRYQNNYVQLWLSLGAHRFTGTLWKIRSVPLFQFWLLTVILSLVEM